jgi:hypothetical protein
MEGKYIDKTNRCNSGDRLRIHTSEFGTEYFTADHLPEAVFQMSAVNCLLYAVAMSLADGRP